MRALCTTVHRISRQLHGAPGGQTANQNTGCATGCEGVGCSQAARYFDTDHNHAIATEAVTQLARICEAAGNACFGIELLNEPATPSPFGGGVNLDRPSLLDFYLEV